jgi:hypothetical protein
MSRNRDRLYKKLHDIFDAEIESIFVPETRQNAKWVVDVKFKDGISQRFQCDTPITKCVRQDCVLIPDLDCDIIICEIYTLDKS